jgi:hypothetical protein
MAYLSNLLMLFYFLNLLNQMFHREQATSLEDCCGKPGCIGTRYAFAYPTVIGDLFSRRETGAGSRHDDGKQQERGDRGGKL